MEQNHADERFIGPMFTGKNVILLMCWLIAMLAALFVALLKNGAWIAVSLTDIVNTIFHRDPSSHLQQLIVEMRLPTAVNALLYGAAMGVAGVLLQRASRIRAACPTTLGLMPAGVLAYALAIHYFEELNEWTAVLACILGAGCGLLLACLLSLAIPMKTASMRRLIGGLIASGIAGMTSYIIVIPWHEQPLIMMLSGGYPTNSVMLPIGLTCCVLCHGISGWMNGSRGNSVWLAGCCLVLAIVLTGAAIMTLGNWAFTGLIASALARWLAGQDYRMMVPIAAMAGGTIISVLNTISYYIVPPSEVSLGIATSLIGLPLLVVLIWKEGVRYANRTHVSA